jgi:hypothetical protein
MPVLKSKFGQIGATISPKRGTYLSVTASPAEIWAGSGLSSSFSPSQCCKGSPVAPGELAKFHILGQDGAIFTRFYMPWYAFWHLVCFGDFGASKCFF